MGPEVTGAAEYKNAHSDRVGAPSEDVGIGGIDLGRRNPLEDADPDLPVDQEAKAKFAGLHSFQCNLALRISLLHLGECG